MRENNVICDNCRVEICHGNHFIGMVTMYQDGFDLRTIFPGDDAHFCHRQCLTEYISKCMKDPSSPLASCCSAHAGGYDEGKD